MWVGSLFTHLDATLFSRFLRGLASFVRPGGILIFTTHGRKSYQWMTTGHYCYEIPERDRAPILRDYKRSGIGYGRYPHGEDCYYGLTITNPAWVFGQIEKVPGIKLVYFGEAAWDNHQDCCACVCGLEQL